MTYRPQTFSEDPLSSFQASQMVAFHQQSFLLMCQAVESHAE